MMGNEGISVADALALRNSGNGNDNWGGNNVWWVILLALFFGWGRGGFGGFGGANNEVCNPCCSPATAQGMADAFNFSQIDGSLRGIANGICDGFYATAQGINGVQSAIQNCCCQTQQSVANLGYQMGQGFCGVDKSILQNSYQNQAGFNGVTNQLASCCCDIERGQDAIKNEIAQVASNLLVANEKNTDRIINHLTQTEMENLRTELQSAQFQLSQLSQTSNIVNQLMPVAKPAYITCSPYASALGYGIQGYNGCGCGCGC